MIDACTVCGKPDWQCNVFVRYQGEGFCSLLCGVKSRFGELFGAAPRVPYVSFPQPAIVPPAAKPKICRARPKRKKPQLVKPKQVFAPVREVIHSSLSMEVSTRQIIEAIKERYEQ